MATITPWEAKGSIDYTKVIKDFGVEPISDKLLKRLEKHAKGNLHHFLRRKIFFAHRDLGWLLDKLDKGEQFYLYTGRGPSGNMHLGHYMPLLFTKWLQDIFDVDLYFQFTDDEKFLFNKDLTLEETWELTKQNAADVLAAGFNPKKTHFIVDTHHAKLLYPHALAVAKRINFSVVKSTFGFTNDQNIGAIFFTAMQAVPAFLPSALAKKNIPCLIPHAIDQDPHFRVSRDVLPKLGYYKPASIQCRFLPGLAGMTQDGKMSSSQPQTTILLSDDEKTVKKKINKYAFSGGQPTIEEHRKLGGNPDVDIAYQYLTFFEEDDALLEDIAIQYKTGELLSGEMKQLCIDKVNEVLAAHQARKKKVAGLFEKCLLKV